MKVRKFVACARIFVFSEIWALGALSRLLQLDHESASRAQTCMLGSVDTTVKDKGEIIPIQGLYEGQKIRCLISNLRSLYFVGGRCGSFCLTIMVIVKMLNLYEIE
jgi:hypothetical protein